MKRIFIVFELITLTLTLSACGGGGGGGSTTPSSTAPAASTATQLSISQALFAEKSLSASGQLSCASCHTDETAHSTAPGVSLPVGGVLMNQQLSRSSPSLMYKSTTPTFSFNNAGEAIGGFDWDGRVNTLADQSAGPLLASAEMANGNINILASKVRALSYFKDFASVLTFPQMRPTSRYTTSCELHLRLISVKIQTIYFLIANLTVSQMALSV
jgi:cytochrome c peroxidase